MAMYIWEEEGNPEEADVEAGSSKNGPNLIRRQRHSANKAWKEFQSLAKFNFTRDVVLLIEIQGYFNVDKYEYVPLRNKIDTGSSENFISREILDDHNMDITKIRQLPLDEQTERTLHQVEGTFTPTHEVELYWHRLTDVKQRRSRFIVVNHAPFDLIIGAKQFVSEDSTAFFSWPGSQTKSKPPMGSISTLYQ
jgi:hypothetical protein